MPFRSAVQVKKSNITCFTPALRLCKLPLPSSSGPLNVKVAATVYAHKAGALQERSAPEGSAQWFGKG